MTYFKLIFYFFVFVYLIFNIVSCKKSTPTVRERLTVAEHIIEQNPDSVLSILDSINNPYSLNNENYNKYLLLQIQAKDKTYKNVANDTIIFRVKDYYLERSDTRNIALSSFYCGRVLQEQNKDKQAINEYQIAERYAEMMSDNNIKGLIQSAIGSIFLKQFIETEAIKHFSHAARYFNLSNNTRNETITYNQIGNAYLMMSVSDSAFYYYKKGFKLAEISEDSLQMANITQCMGIAYRQIGDFILATEYFLDAEKYTTNDDYKAKLYLNLSKNFYGRNILDSAKFYIEKSSAIAPNNGINLLSNIYKIRSQIAEKQKDYDESLGYYKEYTELLEQVVDENKNTEVLELRKKYKYELLQNENNRLKIEEELKKQNIPLSLIRKNKFIAVRRQIAFINKLRENLFFDDLYFEGTYPEKDKLGEIIQLCHDNLFSDNEANNKSFPIWEIVRLTKYYVYIRPSLKELIKEQNAKTTDTKIRRAFSLITRYFEFILPKYLTAFENIFNFVYAEKHNDASGISLKFLITMLEFGFVNPHEIALKEIGLPNDIIRKISDKFKYCKNIEEIRVQYRLNPLITNNLTDFENKILKKYI